MSLSAVCEKKKQRQGGVDVRSYYAEVECFHITLKPDAFFVLFMLHCFVKDCIVYLVQKDALLFNHLLLNSSNVVELTKDSGLEGCYGNDVFQQGH